NFDEHLAASRMDDALATLKEAVRVAPADPRTDELFVRLTEAKAGARLGNERRAIEPTPARRAPAQAVRRGTNAAKVAFAEGEAEVRRQEPARARERFLEAIRLDPTYADPHRSVARLFEGEGDMARARYHLERYLRLGGPDHDRRVRRWLEEHR
ncbi:MAG: tetratricopeptide repeat protein, partial [Myxococcota bacterium]